MVRDESAANRCTNKTRDSDNAVESSNARSQLVVRCDVADYRGRKSSDIASQEAVYADEENESSHGVAK